jgi:hypothetical protein
MDDHLVLELHDHLRLADRAAQCWLLDVSAHPASWDGKYPFSIEIVKRE